MGPHNLHKEFICRNMNEKRDGQRQSQLKDLKGTIGVDASGWFHRSVHTQKGAAVYDMNPKVPLFDAFDKFMTLLNSVINTRENGEHEVILFMDGRSHPLKEANEGKSAGSKDWTRPWMNWRTFMSMVMRLALMTLSKNYALQLQSAGMTLLQWLLLSVRRLEFTFAVHRLKQIGSSLKHSMQGLLTSYCLKTVTCSLLGATK